MIRRPRSRLTAIQSGLSEVLGAEQLRQLSDIGRIRRNWANIVGAVLAQHTEPLNIDHGCLHIAADHPAMAQQIRFLQDEIREACFRKFRVSGIASIRTRHHPGAGMHPEQASKSAARRLTLSEKKAVAREVESVRNKALRLAMFEARLNQLRYEDGAGA